MASIISGEFYRGQGDIPSWTADRGWLTRWREDGLGVSGAGFGGGGMEVELQVFAGGCSEAGAGIPAGASLIDVVMTCGNGPQACELVVSDVVEVVVDVSAAVSE